MRTLSPSNESSKDLNLQESIYMSQIQKSSHVVCRFADITSLSAEIVVIAMVISIAYQSAGQSLAKLWVAHRSHNTHSAGYQLPRAGTRSREDRTPHTRCITASHTVTQGTKSTGTTAMLVRANTIGHGLDITRDPTTAPATPSMGVSAPSLYR